MHVSPAAFHLRVFPLKWFPHSASVSGSFLIGRESCSIPLLSSGNMLLGCQKVRQMKLCQNVLVSADMLSLKMSFGLNIINQQKWKIKDCTQWHICNQSRTSHYSDCNAVFIDLLWHHIAALPGSHPKPQTMQQKKAKKKQIKQKATRHKTVVLQCCTLTGRMTTQIERGNECLFVHFFAH